MTGDDPQGTGIGDHRRFTAYLEEVAGYARDALDKLGQGKYPEEEVEAIDELADAKGDPMFGVKPPYASGYLPEEVQESVESIVEGLETGRGSAMDIELQYISERLSEEIEKHSR